MDYGKKIAQLRKSRGMTQEELGKILNVTYQAVSKWERGESLPDFATMSMIAKYFQVPISYFEDDGEPQTEDDATDTAEQPSQSEPIGMCTVCGRMLKADEAFATSPKIICNDCNERQEKELEQQKETAEKRKKFDTEQRVKDQLGTGFDATLIISLVLLAACYVLFTVLFYTVADETEKFMFAAFVTTIPLAVFACTHAVAELIQALRDNDSDADGYTLKLSLIVGGAAALVNIALFLTLYLTSGNNLYYLILLFVGAIVSFTFVSQFMWGSVLREIFTCGGFTFKLPGIIFSLTPDSIIMMILTKIFLGLLSILVFIVTTVLFALISILGSVFTFAPCIAFKVIKDKKALKELKS